MSLAVYESIILTLGVRVPRALDFNPRVDDGGDRHVPTSKATWSRTERRNRWSLETRGHGHDRAPVFIVVTHLGHAEVLPCTEPIAVLGDYAALVLEGSGARNPQAQAQDAHPAGLIRVLQTTPFRPG